MPYADGAGEKKAFAGGVDGVGVDKLARGEVGAAERGIGAAEGGLVAVEGVMAVALGDVGGGKPALFANHLLALAGARNPLTLGVDHPDKTHTIANSTDCHSEFKRSARGVCGRVEQAAEKWTLRGPANVRPRGLKPERLLKGLDVRAKARTLH